MSADIPKCMGDYDFDEIAKFAHKRFVEGIETVALLNQVQTDREREEVILVSLLDVEDERVTAIELSCQYADRCHITDCRERLRCKLEAGLRKDKTVN